MTTNKYEDLTQMIQAQVMRECFQEKVTRAKLMTAYRWLKRAKILVTVGDLLEITQVEERAVRHFLDEQVQTGHVTETKADGLNYYQFS